MALTDYKVAYDNSYEEVFNKVLVAKSIANMRYEPSLTFGGSVTRFTYDISAARVRTVVRGSASTIDAITDSTESLTINLEKEIVISFSDGELKQTGPLNPGEVIGSQAAVLLATDLDARVLAEVLNAAYTFDTGDLTTSASTGVPFVFDATTTPQAVTRMPAKLKANNILCTNMAFVVDPYMVADLEQYLLGKQFDVVNSIWKNGYSGAISMAEVYVSNNLTFTAVLTSTQQHTTTETITIGGVVLTGRTSSVTTAGDYLIETDEATSLTNLAGLINNPSVTSSKQVALSTADAKIFTDDLKISAVAGAHTVTITCVGAGRVTTAETMSNGSWGSRTVHAYYGKKGAIDLVVQDKSEVDMRPTADRRSTNIFSSYLAGVKTFADGAKKFLNVKIAV